MVSLLKFLRRYLLSMSAGDISVGVMKNRLPVLFLYFTVTKSTLNGKIRFIVLTRRRSLLF